MNPRRLAPVLAVLVLLAVGAGPADAARVPLPPQVTVHEDTPCPDDVDVLGCADVEAATVYVGDGSRFTRWHEVGHLFDHQMLTDANRAWLTRRLGFQVGTPWFEDYADDLSQTMPGEQFADAYAACALGKTPAGRRHRGGVIVNDWFTAYGYSPTARQHRRICNAIAVFGIVRAHGA
jgi:hypothetical protein